MGQTLYGACAIFAALTLPLFTPNATGARYEIDSVETKTTYSITYLGFIPVHGVFEKMTGWFEYDPSQPPGKREARLEVVIDATTLRPTTFDSESKRRMLRGPEFFNVEKFPAIEFRSRKFRFGADGKVFAIDGNITLVGVTKPVSFTVSKSQCEPATTTRAARCTATTELVLKRFDFGMDGWARTVGDEVKIAVDMVAVVPGSMLPATTSTPATAPAPPTAPSPLPPVPTDEKPLPPSLGK